MEIHFSLLLLILSSFVAVSKGSYEDRVLLQNIQALTLVHGRMTNARRSAPVPQLKCVGGSAAGKFIPQVVQCQNRGSDGYDIQWECKADMDNAFRFGKVEVSCEGYEYPDDPYILRGSCGLEYTLEYTKEGYEQSRQEHRQYNTHQNHDYDYHDRSSSYYTSNKKTSGFGSLITLGVAAVIIYFIYKKCLSGEDRAAPTAPHADDPPPYSAHDNQQGHQPPPPGFKPEFTSTHGSGCGGAGGYPGGFTNTQYSGRAGSSTGTGPGFWSGMATGGFLGYLFGNNNGYGTGYGNYYQPTYARPRSSWGSSFFGGNSFSSGGSHHSFSSSSGSSSSGTRTASGFGGTKRR